MQQKSNHNARKLIDYLRLTRPQNNAITALSVLVGAVICGSVESWWKVLLACVSASFISAGGNSINDVYDLDIDRINKPYRPLVEGRISPSSALLFSIVLFCSGVFLSFWIRLVSVLVAVVVALLLIVYSTALKKRLLWGNLTVALVSGCAFIYGGLATHDFRLSLIPAGFAFLFHLGREIMKDIEDLKGDSSRGASTLPIRVGVAGSLVFCSLVFLLLIILTGLPYVLQVFSHLYLLIVIPGVDLILIYVIWSMWRDPTPSNLHRLSTLLKADMLLGLAAIYLGRL
jgi:geranylgeranylglycerol-phosphate geranylgeranyltransferase